MYNIVQNKLKNNRGGILVFAIVFIVILMGFTGLVVDLGIAYANKIDMQSAANSAALSGAQLMIESESEAISMAEDILQENYIDLTDANIRVVNDKLEVRLKGQTPTFFMRVFGKNNVDMTVGAAATIHTFSGGRRIASVGIDEEMKPYLETTYELKWDEHNVSEDAENGWFGALRIDGSGANVFKETLMYGSEGEVAIGSILEIESGNIVGPARQAVDYLVEQDERVLIVPIYKTLTLQGNKVTHVEVTGFAAFYIMEIPKNGKSVIGKFIEELAPGEGDPTATDYGVKTVRLVKLEGEL